MICALCNFKCVAYGNGRKRFDAHEHREVDGVWLKVRKKRALNNEKASKIKKRPLKSKNRAKKVGFVKNLAFMDVFSILFDFTNV